MLRLNLPSSKADRNSNRGQWSINSYASFSGVRQEVSWLALALAAGRRASIGHVVQRGIRATLTSVPLATFYPAQQISEEEFVKLRTRTGESVPPKA